MGSMVVVLVLVGCGFDSLMVMGRGSQCGVFNGSWVMCLTVRWSWIWLVAVIVEVSFFFFFFWLWFVVAGGSD